MEKIANAIKKEMDENEERMQKLFPFLDQFPDMNREYEILWATNSGLFFAYRALADEMGWV